MRSRSNDHAVALFAVVLVLGTGIARAEAPPQPSAARGSNAAAYTQLMTLTDAKVVSFLDAVDDFRAVGNIGTADPSRPDAFARALGVSHQSDEILRKHDFADVGEFQRVAYNAAMAYAVLQKGGKAAVRQQLETAKADQARALEKMREQLGAEQMKMIEGQMEAGMAMAGKMQDVPDENLELVKKYRERMAKLGAR